MEALLNWIEHATFITAKHKNIFLINPNNLKKKSIVTEENNKKKIRTQVLKINPVFSSFSINVSQGDMESIDIRQNRFFEMEVVKSGKKLNIFYGCYPFFVEKDTWIAYDHPDGFTSVSIFGWFDVKNPAGIADVNEDDEVIICTKEFK